MPTRRVVIFFNPISGSGRGEALARAVTSALERRGHVAECVPTRRESAETWMPPQLAGRDAAVIVGGDGAMRLAALPAADLNVPLYHCPAGTENLFARHVGAQSDPDQVVAAIERLEVRRFDLGLIRIGNAESVPFLLMASVGFDAYVIHSLAASRRGAITHLSYAMPIMRAMRHWTPTQMRIRVDDGEPRDLGRGVLVVANLPAYAFRIDPGRGAVADDGLLDVAFLPCRSGLQAAWWAVMHRLRRGAVPGVERVRGQRIDVTFDTPSAWQIDGDPLAIDVASAEASLSVQALAVPVVAPVAAGAGSGDRRAT